jgi:hypothetical protein
VLGPGRISRTPAEGGALAARSRELGERQSHQLVLGDVVLRHQPVTELLIADLALQRPDDVGCVKALDVLGARHAGLAPANERVRPHQRVVQDVDHRVVVGRVEFDDRARCAHRITPILIAPDAG